MRKIIMIILFFFLCSYIYAQKSYILIEDDMVWEVKNGNPRKVGSEDLLENLKESFMFLKDCSLKGTDLAFKTFIKGDDFLKFRVFNRGEILSGGTTFGGGNPNTYPIVRKGKITIGFDKVLSKYVEIFILEDQIVTNEKEIILNSGLNHIEKYTYYYFGNEIGGYKQCNNLGWDYELLMLLKESCEPDTVYITKIDTLKCKRSLVSCSSWGSYAQDRFAETMKDSLNYGNYYITNYKSNDNKMFPWSLLGNITVKLHPGLSWSLVSSYEAGYNDGPLEWKVHFLGIEKNWNREFYIQFGPEYRYREFNYWTTEITSWNNSYSFNFINKVERLSIFDLGCYLQFEYFNLTGDNHFKLYFGQGFRQPKKRIQKATSELQTSIKLELSKWYIFGGFKYQYMPTTIVDTLHVPLMRHVSFEPRLGYAFHNNWIFFLRYRNISNEVFEDEGYQDWSTYRRCDYGGGLFFRPKKFLGIKNLYLELIVSDSYIQERFKNHFQNTDEELMEVKLSFFYHWKQ